MARHTAIIWWKLDENQLNDVIDIHNFSVFPVDIFSIWKIEAKLRGNLRSWSCFCTTWLPSSKSANHFWNCWIHFETTDYMLSQNSRNKHVDNIIFTSSYCRRFNKADSFIVIKPKPRFFEKPQNQYRGFLDGNNGFGISIFSDIFNIRSRCIFELFYA